MTGEAGFWEAVRLERGVGRVVVYHVAPIAKHMEEGPTMWGQWGLCEEKTVRGVLVQHCRNVSQRRAVGPSLLGVDGEEFEFHTRHGGGCRVVRVGGMGNSGR